MSSRVVVALCAVFALFGITLGVYRVWLAPPRPSMNTAGPGGVPANSAAPDPSAAQAEPRVELLGVRVVGDPYKVKGETLEPFHQSRGTTLAMALMLDGGGLLNIVDQDCAITNVFGPDGKPLRGKTTFRSLSVNKAGTCAGLEVETTVVPSASAASLRIVGVVAARFGRNRDTTTLRDLALEVGTKIEVGGVKLRLTSIKPSKSSPGTFDLNWHSNAEVEGLAELRFYAEGSQVKARQNGRMWSRFGSTVSIDLNYEFEAVPKVVTIEIDRWTDGKLLKVPFDVTATLGFAAGRATESPAGSDSGTDSESNSDSDSDSH